MTHFTLDNSARLEVRPVPPHRREVALLALLDFLPRDIRASQVAELLAEAAVGRMDVAGVLAATTGTTELGYIWSQRQAGKVASIWSPWLSPQVQSIPEQNQLAEDLLSAAVDWAAAQGAVLARAVLPIESPVAAQWFANAGFARVTDLLYMNCTSDTFPGVQPPSPLVFEPYTAENHPRLLNVLERTYLDTLDCPAINGVRAVSDTFETYRAAGNFEPQRWLLARIDAQDAGCLLVNDHPPDDQCELVYMGIVPDFRGRGFGLALAQHAQWLTRQAGRPRLLLAVDAENGPALSVYLAAKFEIFDRRQVHLRRLA